ncbi:MAG: DUF5020 family protein, partial [Draconibacterium sp.]|nr:DUF5020 family protein [Draconibacterium sp.]
LLLTLFVYVVSTNAQNIQTHYVFSDDRNCVLTTVEMFKPDNMGSTFFFIDFFYGLPGLESMNSAYFEIARSMKLGKTSPFGFHGEYNGGLGLFPTGDGIGGYAINNAWLTGLDYSWNAEDFSKGFTLQVLYKYIMNKQSSFQLTGVWYYNFVDGKFSFTGFADFWKEDSDFNFDGTADANYVFLTQPQLWFNATEHFSFGSEVEIANNFGGVEGFKVRPTVAVKWIF